MRVEYDTEDSSMLLQPNAAHSKLDLPFLDFTQFIECFFITTADTLIWNTPMLVQIEHKFE